MDAINLYFSYEHNATNFLDLLYKLFLEIIVEFFREAWSAYYPVQLWKFSNISNTH